MHALPVLVKGWGTVAKKKERETAADGLGSAGVGEARSAFARMEPAIRAMMGEDLAMPRFDASRACSIAMGTAQRIKPFHEAILEGCKLTDIRVVDELNDMALAAWHTYLMDDRGLEADSVVPALLEEARPLREKLLRAAELLAHFELADAERVAEIRSGSGWDDLAADLVQLAALFESRWDDVAGKTPIEPAMVARASALGPELKQALATRPTARAPNDVDKLRASAFNLLVADYDQIRRAISYLRWEEDDLETIAPSLFGQKGRARASRSPDVAAAAPEEPPEAAPAPSPARGGEPRLVAE